MQWICIGFQCEAQSRERIWIEYAFDTIPRKCGLRPASSMNQTSHLTRGVLWVRWFGGGHQHSRPLPYVTLGKHGYFFILKNISKILIEV